MASILLVDDEASMREFLEILLQKQGHRVAAAADVAGALRRLDEGGLDLVITDLRLGAESGVDVLRAVKERSPATEVVMVTAFATTENAIQAMKLGAYDYLLKPFKVEELKLVVAKALERRALLAENRVLRHQLGPRAPRDPEIIGRSPAAEEPRAMVVRVAAAPTTVLLCGESGT
ncbi:MAG TPA: response regulator, partial [Anaeromyxobacter sp.]